jgi:hypothetical protein
MGQLLVFIPFLPLQPFSSLCLYSFSPRLSFWQWTVIKCIRKEKKEPAFEAVYCRTMKIPSFPFLSRGFSIFKDFTQQRITQQYHCLPLLLLDLQMR